MWQKISDLAKSLFTFGEALQQNRADVKELQREVRQISTALQLLAREVQHMRESERQEREKTALQLENQLLKFERRLPPAKKTERKILNEIQHRKSSIPSFSSPHAGAQTG